MKGFVGFLTLALRHPLGVVIATVSLAVLSLFFTVARLEFHSNRLDLISSGDRYKQLDEKYSREFAEIPNRVVVVIRADNPEQAKAFATTLARRWERDANIDKVLYRIDVDSLKEKALWYLPPDDLVALRQQLDSYKDLVSQLAGTPNPAGSLCPHQP